MIGRHFIVGCVLFLSATILSSCLARPERARAPYPTNTSVSKKSSDRNSIRSAKNLSEKYADMIGVDVGDIHNIELYQYIDQWMGIPHRLGGQDRRGIDCSAFANQLVREVYRKDLPRTAEDMSKIVKRKYENQLKEGDLVFFKFGGRRFDHVGIYLGNSRFVHVSTSKGVIISNLKDPWYYKYFSRAGSIL
ncbi:C40 family peptidase [Albibacterium indicum]|uniref:C40 family peptidase n=1 Tax=Albibacterium indicum TaxID=2292082 RepID=UPI000E4DACD5|nr:NlpC/P60 family protein [Pedobacter indicus]